MEFDDDYSCGSDGSEYAYDEEDLTKDPSKTESKNYTVLTEADVRRHQEDAITEVCTVLSVPRSAAVILLLHHHWSVHKLQEAWFADEEAVRKAVGLSSQPKPSMVKGSVKCGICLERYAFRKANSANCGHYYCKQCWKSYIAAAVENGSGCLTLRCPEPACHSAVCQDMINKLARDADKVKYRSYLARSFVELGWHTKWCPAAGCENAVNFVGDGETYDVYCDCRNGFCWNCDEEAHSPMDCETVRKWIAKNSSESMNTTWIIANSKPCPKCRRPIQKNQGCMHMTCLPPCRHEFCWICLGDWQKHGGGNYSNYYSCNGYQVVTTSGALGEREQKQRLAKMAIERYTHYYERWEANHKSWKRSLDDVRRAETETIQELSVVKNFPVEEMGFLVEAWKQVVECRRVLKWTYAYGYYIAENETTKKHLFEFLQGEAEAALERLHNCAENEAQLQLELDDLFELGSGKKGFLDEEGQVVIIDTFEEFRTKLERLTTVTRDYFEKLVRALEKGLPDVQEETGGHQNPDEWPCDRCTYMNPAYADACFMCSVPDEHDEDEDEDDDYLDEEHNEDEEHDEDEDDEDGVGELLKEFVELFTD